MSTNHATCGTGRKRSSLIPKASNADLGYVLVSYLSILKRVGVSAKSAKKFELNFIMNGWKYNNLL